MPTKCFSPITIREGREDQVTVQCGKCPGCITRRVSTWSFRLVKQGEVSTSALFVTLTYAPENVPITENGYMTTRTTDLQNFFKRLRKHYKHKLKYYACSEYGSNTFRPHYHIILFNADYVGVTEAWSLQGKPIGYVHFGDVTQASIGYTLKYITKEKRVGLHGRDDREPERSFMSKGLGANYVTPAIVKWHYDDLLNRMYAPLKDGKKAPLARYYKEKIYQPEDLAIINAHIHNLSLDEEVTELTREQIYNMLKNQYRNAKENRSTI